MRMKCFALGVSIVSTVMGLDRAVAQQSSDSVDLVCPGRGSKPALRDFEATVKVKIVRGQGRIRLPEILIPPINSGGEDDTWPLEDVSMGPDTIRARYELNGLNRPKMVIDRNTGRITLDGIERFRGTCDVATKRRF